MAPKSQSSGPPQLTMKQLADSLRPGWSFKSDWLCWPPDTFALISIVLERTGCYRHCLMDYRWFRVPEYSKLIFHAGQHWLHKTADVIEAKAKVSVDETYFFKPFSERRSTYITKDRKLYESAVTKFQNAAEVVEQYWDGQSEDAVDLEVLRAINDGAEHHNPKTGFFSPYREFTEAILQLLAIADSLCAGMGLLEKITRGPNYSTQIVHCLGNLLLTGSGSLSSLAKFHGSVLPKMRTPQGGITTRSLSHHLTFHTTEVEVMWRTIPWYSHHQMSLNVIAVPFPFEITENNFEARSERFQSVQYFSYKSTLKGDEDQALKYLDQTVDLVWAESKKLDQVHILVFPEASLSESQYTHLKRRFYEKLMEACSVDNTRLSHLPLIVAGVCRETTSQPFTGKIDRPSNNEVRMSTFFAGKWYDVAQRKHHRWHLNKNQLVQYWLAGKLPSERRWFEHISVAQRRLTILAPTGWLALTSLICEDLAQLDPVSPIIRGIGPTFLMALLSDGPQINSRWSSRYANVLADDPGTAVLSLTSLGMVKRSRALANNLYIASNRNDAQTVATVALWKDMFRGQQEINLADGYHAIRFTISAKYKEEFTLDGRSDGGNAAVFELEGYEQLAFQETEERLKAETWEAIKNKFPLEGTWLDIRELTAVHFALDSLMELRGRNCKKVCNWLSAGKIEKDLYPRAIDNVVKQMKGSFVSPRSRGIDATLSQNDQKWPSDDIETICKTLTLYFSTIEQRFADSERDVPYYEALYEDALVLFNELKKIYYAESGTLNIVKPANRKYFLVPIAIMHVLRAKISSWQLNAVDVKNDNDIGAIIRLRKKIKSFLIELQCINFSE